MDLIVPIVTVCSLLLGSSGSSAEMQPDGALPPAESLLPESHDGAWVGPNRLWVFDPEKPFRSEGTIDASKMGLSYTWSHEGEAHTGVIALSGQPGAMKADWTDSWHAADGMVLHGFAGEGVVRLFGTYPAGEGPDWGWRIELDTRDPEAFVMRMFNVVPGVGVVPAVVLDGARE